MSFNIVFTKDENMCGKMVIEENSMTIYSYEEISQEEFDLLKTLEIKS